jgi:hypothetical protein
MRVIPESPGKVKSNCGRPKSFYLSFISEYLVPFSDFTSREDGFALKEGDGPSGLRPGCKKRQGPAGKLDLDQGETAAGSEAVALQVFIRNAPHRASCGRKHEFFDGHVVEIDA